ncbi:MAG TPA: hypothetical protein V6D17_11890 [Candidatus Obscuribacterales bacterium]
MGKQRTIQSGKIWENRRPREVLWAIMKLRKVQHGVLQIASPKNNLKGEIGISRSIFLVGGRIENSTITGYEAIKELLLVTDGSFAYLDNGEEPLGPLDQNLKIRLTQVVNLWPELPDRIEDLNRGGSLTRMRAMDSASPYAEEDVVDQSVVEQIKQFEQRTMNLRAYVFWGLFVIATSIVVVLVFIKQ